MISLRALNITLSATFRALYISIRSGFLFIGFMRIMSSLLLPLWSKAYLGVCFLISNYLWVLDHLLSCIYNFTFLLKNIFFICGSYRSLYVLYKVISLCYSVQLNNVLTYITFVLFCWSARFSPWFYWDIIVLQQCISFRCTA